MPLVFRVTLLSLLVIMLGAYSHLQHDLSDFKKYKLLPSEKRNTTIALDYFRVTDIGKDNFYAIEQSDHLVALSYKEHLNSGESLKVGDYVSLKGNYIGGDAVLVSQLHIHKGRNLKRVISVIPLIVICGFFFLYFKFDIKFCLVFS